MSEPKKKALPTTCAECEYWRYSEAYGYRICTITEMAGSPKRLPKECPLRPDHGDSSVLFS